MRFGDLGSWGLGSNHGVRLRGLSVHQCAPGPGLQG